MQILRVNDFIINIAQVNGPKNIIDNKNSWFHFNSLVTDLKVEAAIIDSTVFPVLFSVKYLTSCFGIRWEWKFAYW